MSNEQDYDNTNKGALFTNNKKTTERHPDYTGTINVDGVDYWLSAWVRDSRVGKMLSLSVGDRKDGAGPSGPKTLDTVPVAQGGEGLSQAERDYRNATKGSGQRTGGKVDDSMDDDIPF